MAVPHKIVPNQFDALQWKKEQLVQTNLKSATYTSDKKEIIPLDLSKNLIHFLIVQQKQWFLWY